MNGQDSIDRNKSENDESSIIAAVLTKAAIPEEISNFKDYMNAKSHKLRLQFDFDTADKETDIFSGISIYVNGYTQPSSMELKRLMQLHGGRYEHYFSRETVTHVIATVLPDGKFKDFANFPVALPQWITNSIKSNQLLPWQQYALYNNPKITSFTLPEVARAKTSVVSPPLAAQDPEAFLDKFFQTSRLHHLSTWRNKFQQQISEYLNNAVQTNSQNIPDDAEEEDTETLVIENSSSALKTSRVIVHVDMDCFFASVAMRSNPSLYSCPVVVSHSHANGTAEAASVNYIARKYGIRNGMFMAEVKRLCPDVVVVPYQFNKYEQVSKQMYEIFLRYTRTIEAVSCDEALLDITKKANQGMDPEVLVMKIREEIFTETGCSASAGIGSNILLAKLACKKAKPNGQKWLKDSHADEFIKDIPVRDLPSVGWKLERKLAEKNIKTCSDLQQFNLQQLQAEYGPKTGTTLWNFARGSDNRALKTFRQRKSIGCDVNWGLRFEKPHEVVDFIDKLSVEVVNRLKQHGKKAKTVVLKVKKRSVGQPQETFKYLGHGIADNASHSVTLPQHTDSTSVISKHCITMYNQFAMEAPDVRGIGIHLEKLLDVQETTEPKPNDGIKSFLSKKPESVIQLPPTRNNNNNKSAVSTTAVKDNNTKSTEVKPAQLMEWDQIDQSVLDELPLVMKREIETQLKKQLQGKPQNKDVTIKKRKPMLDTNPNKERKTEKETGAPKKGNLDKFFNQPATEAKTPMPIDKDVWNALPPEIQAELERNSTTLKLQAKAFEPDAKPAEAKPAKEVQVPAEPPCDSFQVNETEEDDTPMSASQLGRVVASRKKATEELSKKISEWIEQAFSQKNLEEVQKFLKVLQSHAEEYVSWREVFNRSLDVSNNLMKKYYRGSLNFKKFQE